MGFQIILSVLIIIAIIKLTIRFYKREINRFYFILFLTIWSLIFLLDLNNSFVKKIGYVLGMQTGANVLVYIGMFLLFYYVFVSEVKFYKMERDIHELVKKNAKEDFMNRYKKELKELSGE